MNETPKRHAQNLSLPPAYSGLHCTIAPVKTPMFRFVSGVPLLAAVIAAWMASACRPGNPAPQAPSTGSSSTPVRVTGTEKVVWDQAASNAKQLASYHYIVYIDDMPVDLVATCATGASSNGTFPCTAPLPKMPPGLHRLQLVAEETEGDLQRSPKSGVLLLDVAPKGPS